MLKPGDENYVTIDGKLKTPLSLTLLLLFFMRGYVAWIISLTFSEDRSLLLQFFYTSTEQFALALLVGFPAVFVLIMLFQLKDTVPQWVTASASFAPLLLWCSWVVDGALLLSIVASHWPSFSVVKAALIFGWLVCLWLLLFSRHLKRFWKLIKISD